MKIESMTISQLYGYINYHINFNRDVTFLYGDNGCGKTTVLDILTNIITGKIFELVNYSFESIKMIYYSNTKTYKTIEISMEAHTIYLTFNDEKYEIDDSLYLLTNQRDDNYEDMVNRYFDEYTVLSEIKDEFNYLYLPLNRKGDLPIDFRFYRRNSHYNNPRFYISEASYYTDKTLRDVALLAKEKYARINVELNRINENFNDEILKSFLDIEYIADSTQMEKYMEKLKTLTIDKVIEIKEKYFNVLKSMKKLDESNEKRINGFFDSLIDDMKNDEEGHLSLGILFKLSELTKIMNIVSKAENVEQKKKKYSSPLNIFIKTVNFFINDNLLGKEIYFDKNGELFLKTTHNNKVPLNQLSSGEKQIVTFFAYLIFGLKDTKQCIFIVDEPELSLHLKWQRIFVDTLLELNPDIQLIFATHAPELIGKHEDKAIKLIPNMRK